MEGGATGGNTSFLSLAVFLCCMSKNLLHNLNLITAHVYEFVLIKRNIVTLLLKNNQ